MLTDIFTSPGASLLILVIQGLFAWALWSLRRVFWRNICGKCPLARTWPVCTANWRPCAVKFRP